MLTECDNCGAIVDASVLKIHDVTPDEELGTRFVFAVCPRCVSPFLLRQDEDMLASNAFERVWEAQERVYPPPMTAKLGRLPAPVGRIFGEARRCHTAKAYTASAIMCRKTLEAICVAHNVKERNLASSLAALKDQGIIESGLFDWANELRITGNAAAHDVAIDVSAQDAGDIFDFTNALLEYVFTFRDRFEAFKKRRASSRLGAS